MNLLRILLASLLTVSCSPPDSTRNTVISITLPVKGVAGAGLERAEFGRDCALQAVPDERELQRGFEQGTCFKLYQRDFAVAVEHFDGPYGTLPLVIFRPRENVEIRRIVVRVVGGPAGGIETAIASDAGRLLGEEARDGAATVFLGYAGTKHRFLEGVDTIDMAADELAAYVGALRRSHPDTPIAVVGESMGGYISARAAPNLPRIPIVLAAPLVVSPRILLARLAASSPEGIDFDRSLVTLSRLHDGRIEPVTSRMLYRSRMLTGILSRHLDTSLADLLARARGECVAIVHGDADETIGISSIPSLRERLPQVRVTAIPGMRHQLASRAEWERAEREIKAAIEASPCR
jgi:pimeloyl-ACP methyl ester carboxylesterase